MSASFPLPHRSGAGGRDPAPIIALPSNLVASPIVESSSGPCLTDRLLFNYQRCNRRAFLELRGDRTQKDPPSDYLRKLKQDSSDHSQSILLNYQPLHHPVYPSQDWIAGASATLALMQQGVEHINRGVLLKQNAQGLFLVSTPTLLIKQPGQSVWGDWCYVPIDIKLGKKPKLDYQIISTFHAYVLADAQGVWPETSWLALRAGKLYAVDLERQLPRMHEILQGCIQDLQKEYIPEVFIAHSRCDLCQWFSGCYSQAQAQQHLSLLPGVTPARYAHLQALKLTTVEALSVANPARLAPLPGFGEQVAEKLVHQAQAVLENRAIPRTSPHSYQPFPLLPADLPSADIELYFDIEAAPDKNLVYLHGVLVVDHQAKTETFHALVAEEPDQERMAWEQFLRLVLQYPEAPVYHFCPYEAQTVQRLAEEYGAPLEHIEPLLERFVDVHKCITDAVTLPIESYALKHIARWLGFNWRDLGANGAQSICWYDDWMVTGDRTYLDAILRYNEDDCRATYWIKSWLAEFAQPFWEEGE
ncbi:MAG: TM0106 family RecB-like putative nuclease [Leptolyngbyaceae cyanobacterium MO_188.B28]|nr:TM0106 family RecB-like putative nuclease [Leptolyngbyaceae cyanobacterium MO_188.B28]